jgi:hypothetical protein
LEIGFYSVKIIVFAEREPKGTVLFGPVLKNGAK